MGIFLIIVMIVVALITIGINTNLVIFFFSAVFVLGVILILNLLSIRTKKCPKCGKRKIYREHSFLSNKRIETRKVRKLVREIVDKNGNTSKVYEQVDEPYEVSEFTNYYKCEACGFSYSNKSKTKLATYENYDEYYKAHKKYTVVIALSC